MSKRLFQTWAALAAIFAVCGLGLLLLTGATVNVPQSSTTLTGDTSASANTLVYRDSQGNIAGAVVQGTQLYTSGSFKGTAVAETANFTTGAATDYFVDATSGAVTVSLPTASANSGVAYNVVKVDSGGNNVTIGSSALGTTTVSSQYAGVRVVSNGTNWYSR